MSVLTRSLSLSGFSRPLPACCLLQGDPPTDLCIIVEGNVDIVKELVIVCKNRWGRPALHCRSEHADRRWRPPFALYLLHRWPVGTREWKERTKRIHKPITLKTLGV